MKLTTDEQERLSLYEGLGTLSREQARDYAELRVKEAAPEPKKKRTRKSKK